jgi:Na+/H+ antiporter NhaC
MNVAKVAIVIILLILMIVVFFALTGLNVRNPMPAVERIIAWLGRVNRSINTYLQGVFYRIRNDIRSRFGNPPTP